MPNRWQRFGRVVLRLTKFTHKNLKGVFIPFTTPFTETDTVDFAGIESNLRVWLSRTGLSGFVALGSTGERVHLNESEALRVIETARATVPHSHSLIVGAGKQSTRGTIDEVREAAA